jgi:hypothetical protein
MLEKGTAPGAHTVLCDWQMVPVNFLSDGGGSMLKSDLGQYYQTTRCHKK